MCAAPGMKSLHTSNMMKNKGTLYCVERDNERFNVLSKMLEDSGSTCAKAVKGDTLTFSEC